MEKSTFTGLIFRVCVISLGGGVHSTEFCVAFKYKMNCSNCTV